MCALCVAFEFCVAGRNDIPYCVLIHTFQLIYFLAPAVHFTVRLPYCCYSVITILFGYICAEPVSPSWAWYCALYTAGSYHDMYMLPAIILFIYFAIVLIIKMVDFIFK